MPPPMRAFGKASRATAVEPLGRRARRPDAAGQRAFQIRRRATPARWRTASRARPPSGRGREPPPRSPRRSSPPLRARARPRARGRRRRPAPARSGRGRGRGRRRRRHGAARPASAALPRRASPRRPWGRGRSPAAAWRRTSAPATAPTVGRGGREAGAGARRHREHDALPELLSRPQRVGPGQRQRAHIGLVGGVGPVALVLHLEGVALHAAGHLEAGRELVGQRPQVHHGLDGVDQVREAGLDDAPVDMLDAWPAGPPRPRWDGARRSRCGW